MESKRGSVMFYSLMLGIVIFVLALALGPAVSSFTNSAMNQTVGDTVGLDCDNTTDKFVKATCIVADLSLVYFIGSLILMAFVIVGSKILIGSVVDE